MSATLAQVYWLAHRSIVRQARQPQRPATARLDACAGVGQERGDGPAVQRPLFLLLAAIGHTTGLKAAYPEYLTSDEVVEPSPEALALLTDDGRLKPFDPD